MSSKSENVALAAVKQVKEAAIAVIDEKLEVKTVRVAAIEAGIRMGGILFAQSLGQFMTVESFRALIDFAESKAYTGFGYTTIESFLDKHPNSPMSYDQFNDRKKLLEAEGEDTFEILNSIKAPLRSRKLLAGAIAMDGEQMVIGEHRVDANDPKAVLAVIKELAKEIATKDKQITRGKADLEKAKRRVVEAERTGGAGNMPDTVMGALLLLGGAQNHLNNILLDLPLETRKKYQRTINDYNETQQGRLIELMSVDQPERHADYQIPDDLLDGMDPE